MTEIEESKSLTDDEYNKLLDIPIGKLTKDQIHQVLDKQYEMANKTVLDRMFPSNQEKEK
jgi:hypothetical protein